MQRETEITEQKIGNSSFAVAYIIYCCICKKSQTQFHIQKKLLHYKVECSGDFPNISPSITVGAPISPQLATLYLILLDLAFSQHPAFYYRRTTEYWGNIVLPEDSCVTYP